MPNRAATGRVLDGVAVWRVRDAGRLFEGVGPASRGRLGGGRSIRPRCRRPRRPGEQPAVGYCRSAEAGRRLAERLRHLRDAGSMVLALPCSGVPSALPIAMPIAEHGTDASHAARALILR